MNSFSEGATNASLDGGRSRPLFTPHTAYGTGLLDNSMSSRGLRSGGAGTTSGARNRGAGSGARGGQAGTGSGAGRYRLSVGNSPSFMSRSDMSMAMSMASDDESGGAGEGVGVGGGLDESVGRDGGDSIGDMLSP